MQTAFAICAGIALAAACGFRVFVPLLVASLAVRFGQLTPSPNLAWIGGDVALIILAAATIAELAGYFIPWLDHLLDTIATPVAVIAGALVAAAAFGNIDPTWKWTLAILAGGGAAASVQGSTVLTRLASTATTGGAANPLFAAIEAIAAIILAVLAILVPVLAIAVLLVIVLVLVRILRRSGRPKSASPPALT